MTLGVTAQEEWRELGIDPRRCKTSLVGQRAGLSVPRSPVRFRQNSKNREPKSFEHTELRAKLLDYFLRSLKSNNNQTRAWLEEVEVGFVRDTGLAHTQERTLKPKITIH